MGEKFLQKDILSILREVQRKQGYLTGEAMAEVAKALVVPLGEVYGVATFYPFLSTEPMGKHVIMVCKSVPCWLKGSQEILEAIRREVRDGQEFTLLAVNCIGACDLAPAMLVDGELYGNLTPEKVAKILKELREEPCRNKGLF